MALAAAADAAAAVPQPRWDGSCLTEQDDPAVERAGSGRHDPVRALCGRGQSSVSAASCFIVRRRWCRCCPAVPASIRLWPKEIYVLRL